MRESYDYTNKQVKTVFAMPGRAMNMSLEMGNLDLIFTWNSDHHFGEPVRTLRPFCDDRAAPIAPALHFLCAKEMRPIIWWPAFGAPFC